MKCEDTQLLLTEYLDDELVGTPKQAIESHLESCESCRAQLDSLTQLSKAIQNLPRMQAPVSLESLIMKELETPTLTYQPTPFPAYVKLFAAAVVLLGASLFMSQVQPKPKSYLQTSRNFEESASPSASSAQYYLEQNQDTSSKKSARHRTGALEGDSEEMKLGAYTKNTGKSNDGLRAAGEHFDQDDLDDSAKTRMDKKNENLAVADELETKEHLLEIEEEQEDYSPSEDDDFVEDNPKGPSKYKEDRTEEELKKELKKEVEKELKEEKTPSKKARLGEKGSLSKGQDPMKDSENTVKIAEAGAEYPENSDSWSKAEKPTPQRENQKQTLGKLKQLARRLLKDKGFEPATVEGEAHRDLETVSPSPKTATTATSGAGLPEISKEEVGRFKAAAEREMSKNKDKDGLTILRKIDSLEVLERSSDFSREERQELALIIENLDSLQADEKSVLLKFFQGRKSLALNRPPTETDSVQKGNVSASYGREAAGKRRAIGKDGTHTLHFEGSLDSLQKLLESLSLPITKRELDVVFLELNLSQFKALKSKLENQQKDNNELKSLLFSSSPRFTLHCTIVPPKEKPKEDTPR